MHQNVYIMDKLFIRYLELDRNKMPQRIGAALKYVFNNI